jgi:hypothetical protein
MKDLDNLILPEYTDAELMRLSRGRLLSLEAVYRGIIWRDFQRLQALRQRHQRIKDMIGGGEERTIQ